MVEEIISFLSEHFDEDFLSYSTSLAGKRIKERVQQLSLPDLTCYRHFLTEFPDEPEVLARMLRVRFSSFFRDALEFELLGSVILPSMIHRPCKGLFRGWSAACACGEEAYSLAIILDEAMQVIESPVTAQIFATDIAEEALAEARAGSYPADRLGGVTLKRLGSHFTADGAGYRVSDRLGDMVTFSRHDLLDQRSYVPPESLFGGFDLVLCRNFLMYLDAGAYSTVFDKLFRALNSGGVLMLGKAESVPERYAPYLERVVEMGNMYRRRA